MDDEQLFAGDGDKLFRMARERDVDAAVKKVKAALGSDWLRLRHDSQKLLEAALSRAWSNVGPGEWDECRFSLLSLEAVRKIAELEADARGKKISAAQAATDVAAVLAATKSK